ncbi:MAG TPA: acetate--CoA ligase family protein [Acetobacteraceae bacterium]|nr:acetate--CoA ligase family protein [Acetobacteraceae bacterium]
MRHCRSRVPSWRNGSTATPSRFSAEADASMRNVDAIMRARTVAVIGASASRTTQGNHVIANLRRAGFAGRILPVHATAAEINDLPAVNSIAALPAGTDVAVVAIPAAGVAACLTELEQARVRAAVVFSNGFTPVQEQDFRRVSDASSMTIHGPNCMGLIDLHQAMPLYPATITAKVRPGNVALIAQSGSAAISLMNSSCFGISTVVTVGSEFQVTAPDYLRFFATDDRTAVIGVVLESIQRPSDFADAVRQVYAAGKSIAVLKVGLSEVGNRAVQAHTGAMISRSEAYARFFARHHLPVASDYDELIATLECFSTTPRRTRGSRIGIVGISGGETALTCDIATSLGIPIAVFGDETRASIIANLPGAAGVNPLDLGATVNHTPDQDRIAISAILQDPEVDALAFVQDAQATLTPTMLNNYTPNIIEYGKHARRTDKPVVLISPSAENTHPRIHEMLADDGVPVLRGLRPGLVALRNLGIAEQRGSPEGRHARVCQPHAAAEIRADLMGISGPLPIDLARKILTAYGIPIVCSATVSDLDTALMEAARIGYPLVVKIASPDIAHRSDIGGVKLGVTNDAELRGAIAGISADVANRMPKARITGFELQEYLVDHIEAMAGFVAAPPFGALLTVGTGGTMVELQDDRSVDLCPLDPECTAEMIGTTRLGSALHGYRNLIPKTDIAPLALLAANLSELAFDLSGAIAECDLNPVLVRKGTGEVRVADFLLVAKR